MKAAALAILALSGLGLLVFLGRYAVWGVEVLPGMLNPSLRIEVPRERQIQLLVLFLWFLAAAYVAAVVAWADKRFRELRSRLTGPSAVPELPQPPEVKRLKDAIREGNPQAVRQHANEGTLAFRDEHLLTPYELAELYGDEAVTEAVREAGRHGSSVKEPASRFAMGQERRH
jgi:hypothetical protein